MKKIVSLLALLIFFNGQAQLQSPAEFLGYELGTQFTRHHQVIDYVKHVAENSTLATTASYGKTYEGRILQLVYLSSAEN